jgi:anti-sigma regulatory factor (Ser/Thr protein kinase)
MHRDETEALDLALPNELAAVSRLHDVVQAFAAGAGLPEIRRLDLCLALEEAFVNVVRYAWEGGQHTAHLRLAREAGAVVAVLEDDGRPFNPLDLPPFDPDTPLQERREGGMGMHMVRCLTDEQTYERCGGRNRLRLTVRCNPPETPTTTQT